MNCSAAEVNVEVFFDLVCPWCFIGKREFDTALRDFAAACPGTAVQLQWRSFPLLPDTPADGLDYQTFYERRLGGRAAVQARRAQVQDAARATGLQLNFERIRRLPNTFLAHSLVQHAATLQVAGLDSQKFQSALVERLFEAYFVDGQDIGDPGVLAALASACGVDGNLPLAQPGEIALQAQLRRWQGAAAGKGISSVPTVIINRTRPLVGAIPSQNLLQALIAASRPALSLVRTQTTPQTEGS